jgi:sugar lactone lactonase YvrE
MDETAMVAERAMRPMENRHLQCLLRTLGRAAGAAVVLLGFCAQGTLAQNAAQTSALARLGYAQSRVHANISSGSAEATNTTLYLPRGLAFDAAGDLFIADTGNHIIREVDLDGIITTVAGTGEQGFGGDGGDATSALLDSPSGIAVDSSGNLYIADTGNQRIRMVSGGTISTMAGTGVAGFSGDGATATSATLNNPVAVAVDSRGYVYIADAGNHRIREIAGATISTVAGNGEQSYSGDGGLATAAGLDSPNGVAVDASYNLYIGDTLNQRVRMVTYSTGIISTIAGTGVMGFNSSGTATTTELANPRGIAIGSTGTVYVADSDNNRIRAISSGQVTTVAGAGEEGNTGDTGVSTSAALDTPLAVAVLGSSISLADTDNQKIRVVTDGTVNTSAGQSTTSTESLSISGSASVVYGTGTLTVSFSHGSNTATGLVTFYDGRGSGPAVAGTASLSSNAASLGTSQLAAGTHYLIASYAGDSSNPAIVSGIYVLTVTPVQLTAVASSVSQPYGQAIPTLTGTLSGMLSRDASNVQASYTTAATATSSPGTYPIAATLTGTAAGNYTVALGAGSGSLTITRATTQTVLTASSQSLTSGASVTLTATVTSTTSGTPTGTVSFYDGASLLNSTPASLSSGVATLKLTTLPTGTQSITAVYSGDTDFLTSTSSGLAESVSNSADFTLTASPATQTVQPSHSVDYTITLTPGASTFANSVSLSVSGLPSGVTASFAPASIAAGSGASTVVLTLSANADAQWKKNGWPLEGEMASTALALLMFPLAFSRRMRRTRQRLSRASRTLIALLALAIASLLANGCGNGFFNHPNQSHTITVTAVSGSTTRTTDVTLIVQ